MMLTLFGFLFLRYLGPWHWICPWSEK
jgi:hypothetical protein